VIPTTPAKSTFLWWNQLSPLHFNLFPSFRYAIGQSHEANLWIPCSVKTIQYRVRKSVHEGKPWATNRSRVNAITVQCEVGNCWFHEQIPQRFGRSIAPTTPPTLRSLLP